MVFFYLFFLFVQLIVDKRNANDICYIPTTSTSTTTSSLTTFGSIMESSSKSTTTPTKGNKTNNATTAAAASMQFNTFINNCDGNRNNDIKFMIHHQQQHQQHHNTAGKMKTLLKDVVVQKKYIDIIYIAAKKKKRTRNVIATCYKFHIDLIAFILSFIHLFTQSFTTINNSFSCFYLLLFHSLFILYIIFSDTLHSPDHVFHKKQESIQVLILYAYATMVAQNQRKLFNL